MGTSKALRRRVVGLICVGLLGIVGEPPVVRARGPVAPQAQQATTPTPPPRPDIRAVEGTAVRGRPFTPPQAIDRQVVVSADRWVRVEGVPVELRLAQAVAKDVTVQVKSVDPKRLELFGAEALAFQLLAEVPATISVAIDYTAFRPFFGGDWGDRVQLVEWPDCVPDVGKCVDPVPVERFTKDFARNVVSATVTVGPTGVQGWKRALVGSGSTLGLSSVSGSFGATSLSPSGTWRADGNGGNFSYSLPFVVPPAGVGSTPDVGIAYSSSSVDGMTSSTNNQAGPVGLGWSLPAGQMFIETTYLLCNDSRIGGGTKDLCEYVPNATISLNGVSSELVHQSGFTEWRLKDDPVWKVERLAGASNGDKDGWYWKVTGTDGTQYFFGFTIDSAQVVPVRGLFSATKRCYSSPQRICNLGYRWNLTKSVDTNGNVTTYTYAEETNKYGALGDGYTYTKSYDSAANLATIDYSYLTTAPANQPRARVEFAYLRRCTDALASNKDADCPTVSNANGNSYPDVPTDLYCQATNCFKPTPAFFSTKRMSYVTTRVLDGSANAVMPANSTQVRQWRLVHSFPDNTDGTNSKLYLSWIQAIVPGDTATPPTAVAALPASAFYPTLLANRKDYNTGGGIPQMYLPRVGRVFDELGQETFVEYFQQNPCTVGSLPNWGSNTTDCFPSYQSFPGGPAGFGVYNKYLVQRVTVKDLVTNTSAGITGTGVAPNIVTNYTYGTAGGANDGAAWAHDDNWLQASGTTSWGEARGYFQVTATTGTGAVKTVTTTRFFRGMNGDQAPGGGTKTVNLTTSIQMTGEGTAPTYPDNEWQAGMILDTRQMDGTTANYISGSRTTYTVPRSMTGVAPGTGLPVQTSRAVVANGTRSRLAQTSGWREQASDALYDTFARQVTSQSSGFLDLVGDEQCTQIGYTAEPYGEIIAAVATTATKTTYAASPVLCDAQAGPWTSINRTFYDGNQTTGITGGVMSPAAVTSQLLTNGRTTWTGNAVGLSDNVADWVYATAAFNMYGQPATATDALGRTISTTYSSYWGFPSAMTFPALTSKGQGSLTTSTVINPKFGAPDSTTDQNGNVTEYCYDNLGRLNAAGTPLESGSLNCSWTTNPNGPFYGVGETPAAFFNYLIYDYAGVFIPTNKNGPNTVVAYQLQSVSPQAWQASHTLVDGLGRTRETQTPNTASGRVITAATFDDRSNQISTIVSYPTTGALNTTVVTAPALPAGSYRTTATVYDTLNRATNTSTKYGATVTDTVVATFDGAMTTADPSVGTNTRTTVDGQGRTITTERLATGNTVPGTNTFNDGYQLLTTSYVTNGDGTITTTETELAATATNTPISRSVTVDLTGRPIVSNDPDAGVTTTTYDQVGNTVAVDDAQTGANTILRTAYDELNRPIYLYTADTTRTLTQLGAASNTTDTSPAAVADRALLVASFTYDGPNGTLTTGMNGLSTADVSWQSSTPWRHETTAFDARNRAVADRWIIPITQPVDPLAGTYTATYTYDRANHQTSATLPGNNTGGPGETVTIGYDPTIGAATTLTGTDQYVKSTVFDTQNRVTRRELNKTGSDLNPFQRTYSYDPATGRLATLTNTWGPNPAAPAATVTNTQLTYDTFGNITAVTDTASNSTECFLIDHWNRLTRAYTTQGTTTGCTLTNPTQPFTGTRGANPYDQQYGYTDTGNITSHTDNITPANNLAYTYTPTPSPGPHAPTQIGPNTYTYTVTGNTATIGTDPLTYDKVGRLTSYKTETYTYTTTNQRILRTTNTGGTLTRTLYLGAIELTATGTSTPEWTTTYTIAGAVVAYRTAATPGVTPGNLQWNCAQHQANTTCTPTTNPSTTPTSTPVRTYTPYGQPRTTVPLAPNDKGFLHQTKDPNQLTYLNNRYYNPATHTLISVDPLVAQTRTAYAYTSGPNTLTDPTGLEPAYLRQYSNCIYGANPGGQIQQDACAAGKEAYFDKQPSEWRAQNAKYYHPSKRTFLEGYAGPDGPTVPSIVSDFLKGVGDAFNEVATYVANVARGLAMTSQAFSQTVNAIWRCYGPHGGHDDCADADAAMRGLLTNPLDTLRACSQLGAGKCTGQILFTVMIAYLTNAAASKTPSSAATNAVTRAPRVLRVGELRLPGVPKGVVGTPTNTGKGLDYAIPRGTAELSESVASIRIMDPVMTGKYVYPNGYAVYMNAQGQRVNPLTGQMIHDLSDPFAHIPLP